MGEVNLYIHKPCSASIRIASEVRGWGTCKVRFWVSGDDMRNCDDTVRKVVSNWRDRRIVDENILVDHSIQYYQWDMVAVQVEVIASDGLKALIQRCLTQNMQFVVLGDSAKSKGRMACFVDAPQRMELPASWQKFKWLSSYEEVFQFCQKQGVFDFDVSNTSRFHKTGKIEHGEPVYKELATGNFIYFDNLHKNHYEVFSPNGRHLGEMSLNGNLNHLMADSNKYIEL